MKSCKYRNKTILLLILFLSIGINLVSLQAQSNPKQLKIGAILPLSGEMSYVGRELRRGMELAQNEIKDKGIKLIIEDDQSFDNVSAVKAVNKLVNIDKTDVILNAAVNTAPAIAPILNKRRIPGIVVWDSNAKITNLGEWIFALGVSTEEAGKDMAKHAFSNLGAANVSVVSTQDEWSEIISKAFIKQFKKMGGKIDLHLETLVDENDFRTILSKIKIKNSQAIYFPLFPQALKNLIAQAKALHYEGELLTADSISQEIVNDLGKNAEGLYASQVWVTSKTLQEKYTEKYGSINPINLGWVALGYDALMCVKQLSDKLTSKGIEQTRKAFKDNLINFSYNGISGYAKLKQDRRSSKRQKLLIVKNGFLKSL